MLVVLGHNVIQIESPMAAADDLPEAQFTTTGVQCQTQAPAQVDEPQVDDQQRLRACSRAPMVNLHRQLASPRISVLLADRAGHILDMVSEHETAVTATPEDWPLTERFRAVQAKRHSSAIVPEPSSKSPDGSFAFGIAAPINAASGGVIGIVDRSGHPGWGVKHVSAMLQITAEMIERRVVETDQRGFLLLHFHTRADLLFDPFDAIALFDRDSRLIAYNRLAANLLSLNRNGLSAHCHDYFDTQWPGLVGSAALATSAPIVLRMRNGKTVLANARLR